MVITGNQMIWHGITKKQHLAFSTYMHHSYLVEGPV